MKPGRGGWLILLTLVAAFLLTMMRAPLGSPEWLGWLQPSWILLLVFYWVMRVPHRIGLFGAWMMGLFVDIVHADPLGLNGLVLASVACLTWRWHERLRMYSVLQQAGVVALLVLASEIMRRLAHGQGASAWLWATLLPAATSMALWPALCSLLGRLAQRIPVE